MTFTYIPQVAKFVPDVDAPQQMNDSHEFPVENERRTNHVQNDEHSLTPNSDTFTSSQTVGDVDVVHVVGDIIQVCYNVFILAR
jgi:hypothetical protein